MVVVSFPWMGILHAGALLMSALQTIMKTPTAGTKFASLATLYSCEMQ